MFKKLIFSTLTLLAVFLPLQASQIVSADSPDIKYFGRVTSDHEYSWPGIYIKTNFTGTSISAILSGSGQYMYFIDGKTLEDYGFWENKIEGNDTVELAFGLADTLHSLVLCKVNETNSSKQGFEGFVIDDGAQLQEPDVHTRKIEYIGDSFMAGYACESGSNSEDHPDPYKAVSDSTNTCKAFTAVSARAVDAEYIICAYSGLGVYCDLKGDTTATLPSCYDYALHYSKSVNWDFSSWVPDVVVIGLGINDFNGGASQSEYEKAYNSFIDRIRENYNNHPKFILTSTSVYQHPEALTAVENITAEQQSAGHEVYYFNYEYEDLGFSAWNGVHYHPNEEEQKAIGEALAARINQTGFPDPYNPEPPFSLSVSSENGTVSVTPDKSEYDDGEEVTLIAAADEGYIFEKWSGSISSADDTITITMDSDKYVSALFSIDTTTGVVEDKPIKKSGESSRPGKLIKVCGKSVDHISIMVYRAGSYDLRLYSLSGQLISKKTPFLNKGRHILKLNHNSATGLYLLETSLDGITNTHRLIMQ